MLEAHNIHKFYGARQALDSVSFSIRKGEVVGFLGKNGAGKTTTMRLLSGFLAPTHGEVKVAGLDPRLPRVRDKIGYLPETNPLPARMRVSEYLCFRSGIKGLLANSVPGRIGDVAKLCGIDSFLDRLIGQLSKGMRQRVGLADALLANPEALILDEPTAGLDPKQAAETRDLIERLGKDCTVLLSSHILSDVERLCDRVIILNEGRVIADDRLENICGNSVDERTVILELITLEPVREALRSIPGVRAIGVAPPEGDSEVTTVRLTTPAGVDLRREISSVCASRGWLITGMRQEPIKLEDIFRKLTGSRRLDGSRRL